MPTDPTIGWYDQNAASQAERYESVDSADVFEWVSGILPDPPGLVIDLGAGSGRDAAWFAAKGFQVIAVEPAARMRAEGQRRHCGLSIQWLDDRLPALTATIRLGVAADIVNLGAVWMHLASEEDRRRAFRKVVSLTRSGGLILMTVRSKPFDDVRCFKSTTVYDIESLARAHGLVVARVAHTGDAMGRGDVSWDCVALRLPHDGTDALPLLRHVILNDSKATTYKLALLRSLCRAAESAAGMAAEADDDHVAVPVGLIALFWMRLYAPLLAANLPQSPKNERQGKALGFVNDAFAAILRGRVPVNDLRVGATFWGEDIAIVHEAIKLSAQTIRQKPAYYTTYSDGTQIFPCVIGRLATPREPLNINARYLESIREPLCATGRLEGDAALRLLD